MLIATIVKVFFFLTGAVVFGFQLTGQIENSFAITAEIYGLLLLSALIDVAQQVVKDDKESQ